MPPQSRGRAPPPSLHALNLSQPSTPDERTPRAIRRDNPFTTSASTPTSTSTSADDGDIEQDEYQGLDMDDSNYTLDEATSPESSSESEGEDPGETTASPFLHHSNSSFLMANAFAPPYYNRPPTPLPASPSLTSLLRPPFSTTTSRPTTPDSSEGDTPNDTEGVVAKSARIATTVPRASPKVPTYEYYGFVVYLLSGAAFLMYLLWSYLPSPFLRQLGIHYYPNRWWSLAIPSYLVMTIVYIYVALASYNMGYLTLPMGSLECIVDEAAHVAVLDGKGRLVRRGGGDTKQEGKKKNEGRLSAVGKVDWKSAWSEGTDAVMDVPVGGVCEILYG